MAKCKFCQATIGWKYDGERWVPLNEDQTRHNCRSEGNVKYRIRVYCKDCQKWMPENDVTFVNIEEDDRGMDVLTFDCPECKQTQRSHRIG